ncbi:hypothetical protein, partial [Pseudoalteromonas sp. A757]|uniref:hypothetical protein n=1 Tax=Pseudoalteromonas sp. A757 TaxID=2250709 RepID=UPI00195FCFB2
MGKPPPTTLVSADAVVGASLPREVLYLKSLCPKQQKTRRIAATGFFNKALTMFYFHMGSPHYHRRCFVSLL